MLELLCEPESERSEPDTAQAPHMAASGQNLWKGIAEVLSKHVVLLLIAVFIGANFVAVAFLSWMPSFLYRKFHMSLSMTLPAQNVSLSELF